MTPLLVALGAALGAPARYVVADRWDAAGFPLGTWLVNVLGSLLLGICSGLALDGRWLALLASGFCGGFTTYSAFSVQIHARGRWAGTVYAAATLLAALPACGVGYWLGAQA